MSERFRKLKLLGKGGFGKVYEAIDMSTGETVALKEMFGDYANWDQCCNLTEVKALQVLNHPNIVGLKEVFLSGGKLYLAYELLERDLY
jgi:serine/threonine protein kinase